MKTLVTGGAGFIGHNLVKELLRQGDFVRVFDDLSKGEVRNLEGIKGHFEFVRGDLLDGEKISKVAEGMDTIYHLAAKIGGIGYFHKIPATLLRDNDKMTYNVFDVAKESGAKVVYLSSSMVFENAVNFPSSENDLKTCPPPTTSYGFSKLGGEYIARAYNDEFGVPFVIARPFNAYGPGEAPGDYVGYSHVIPDLVKKVLGSRNGKIEILGDGSQTRCFTFTEDLAKGIALIGRKGENDDFNIGTSEEMRIDYLAERIWNLMGRIGSPELIAKESYSEDVPRRVPDCSKVKEKLGWVPKTSLEEGLKKTIPWIVNRIEKEHH